MNAADPTAPVPGGAPIGPQAPPGGLEPTTASAMELWVRVFLPVPPPRAFAAFANDIDSWWGYRLRDRARCTIEARVGGRFTQEWDNGGMLFGEFTVWDPPSLIVLRGPLTMTRPVLNTVEFLFEPAPDGTHLSVTHRAVGDLEAGDRDLYESGWRELLGDGLFRYVTRA